MNAILIKATDEISIVTLEGDTRQAMMEHVAGWLEHVCQRYLRSPYCLIVNEEGVLLDLPINNAASLLYGGPIVGNVLILRDGINDDGEYDIVGLEETEAKALVATLRRDMAFLVPAE